MRASSAVITRINSAGIVIVTADEDMGTSTTGVTSIGGTGVAIVTVNVLGGTSTAGITSFDLAFVSSETLGGDVDVVASVLSTRIAGIVGAGISSRASNWNVLAKSVHTRVSSARVVVIAGNVGVNASSRVAAGISCASIIIIASILGICASVGWIAGRSKAR